MKCKRLLALALAAALCIVAAACGTKNNEPDTPAKTDTPTAAPGGTQTVGDTGDGTVREDGSYVPGQVDRLRLTYNGNVSSALYVTSAAQLPDYPELSAYDDAFFKDHAHTPMSAISICIRFILLFCCPQYHKTFPLKMALVIFCAFKDEIKITTNPKAMP